MVAKPAGDSGADSKGSKKSGSNAASAEATQQAPPVQQQPPIPPAPAPAAPVVSEEAKDHWKKGNALFESSKFQEAIAEYDEALKIDEKYADAYFNRALTFRIVHDYDSAQKDLEVVLKLQPKSHDAPLLIGDILESKNDFLGARFWYEKSLANNPNYTEAKNRLEHIDSLIHMESQPNYGTGAKKSTVGGSGKSMEQEGTLIEEGQIKRIAFTKPKIKFNDVVGLDKVKKYLKENIVYAIERPELFKKYGKKRGLGLILYGPPGVGKTLIVSAIGGEASANVLIARINQIIDMYTGNTEKNLHAIFEQARKNTPCIIMFDELDAMGTKRGGEGPQGGESSAMRIAVNQFLTEMNGLEENPEGIFVIGTTNQPWDIDPALKRSGRFGDAIYLKPPGYRDRVALIKFEMKNKPSGWINYGRIARATTGYSPADISRIVDKAAMRPLLHEYRYNKGRSLGMSDFIAILKDKDTAGSSLDEWYSMVKKDVISKTETQMVDGKKQEIVKEGKLDAQEKILYKKMVKDIKWNTNKLVIGFRKITRWWATYLF